MKRQAHRREKKSLSAPNLLRTVREFFGRLVNPVKPRKISLSDCLMSALAVFSLKSPSLLAFDEEREEDLVRHNLKTLYGIKNAPCDSYMREILDEVEPETIRESFLAVFNEVQRGKLLQRYEFLDSYLCLLDGSQVF